MVQHLNDGNQLRELHGVGGCRMRHETGAEKEENVFLTSIDVTLIDQRFSCKEKSEGMQAQSVGRHYLNIGRVKAF